ncbi:alpha-hydroxy acid oxidase [Jatrophihabitans sp. DSM 45814]
MSLWIRDLEESAKSVLGNSEFDFVGGAAGREYAQVENVEAWRRIRLLPHVLRDVDRISTATTVLGSDVSMPILIAPMGCHTVVHEEGEVATAVGASRVGTLFAVPERGAHPLEKVRKAAGSAAWFQIYMQRDRDYSLNLVRRAEAAGYTGVILTVDVSRQADRYRDSANGYKRPVDHQLGNVSGDLAGSFSTTPNPTLTPKDIERLAAATSLPIIVKGILRPDDARVCRDSGARGVIVSNHGGRQLESAVPTAQVLRSVVEAVDPDVEVYVDGGIRSAEDVVKAIAVGARAVFVGRPVLWALAVEGAAGVERLFTDLRADLERAMAQCGATSVSDLTYDLIAG